MTRIASAGRNYSGKYKVTPPDATIKRRINVLWVDPVRGTLWGCGALGTYGNGNASQVKLFRSDDNGVTWTLVYSFGTRAQTIMGVDQAKVWPDMIFSVDVIHKADPVDDVILVTCSNQAAVYDGAIYRSANIYGATIATMTRAKFADDQGMGTGVDLWLAVGTGYPSWSMDNNGTYAVCGEYSGKSGGGTYDRSIWMTVDDGVTWKRIWFQPGDTFNNAINLHCHMTRIDPDGGCWISFGDQSRGGADDTDTAKGLWHSPAQPTPITSGKPAVLTAGDFTRVYSHASVGNRVAVRPITGFFHSVGSVKYFYVGEDSMTPTEARTITRIRYDDASYTAVVKANYTGTDAVNLSNGGIFGTCQIDDLHACAFATAEPVNSYTSRPALFVTSDGGETWTEDTNFHILQASQNILIQNAKSVCRHPDSDGYVWFGRAPDDPFSFAYKPVFL